MDWDELDKRHGLSSAGDGQASDPWAELDRKHLRQEKGPAQRPAPKSGGDLADSVNAYSSGAWRGLLRLAGLPMDTAQNVVDLLKAGVGSAYTATTGKAPPSALELADRSNVPGTSDYLIAKARQSGFGRNLVDPYNPEYEGGYIQNAGSGMAGAVAPGTAAQAFNRALIGNLSATTGKAAYDATGNPAAAVVASFVPNGVQSGVEAGLKRVIRGGEQGRQDMQKRVLDLERAGITDPTLGLASGNRMIGGLENLLQNTPGAMGVMSRSRQAALNGLQNTVENAANAASPVRGALPAGQQIQSGITSFKDAFKAKQAGLFDRLDNFIPANTPTAADNAQSVLARLNADIPGAPNLSKFFKNGKILAIEDALQADLNQQRTYTPSQLKTAIENGANSPGTLSAALNEGKLPYQAIKQTRTMVGNELADNSLLSDVPRSKWNPLYAGLSQDMQIAAANSGPGATQAFNRANAYTRSGMDRLERLRPFADKTAPEQAFTSLVQTTKENGSTLRVVKKSLPEAARGTVAGTVIERLGKSTPGQQNDAGNAWSPDRFLTNWNSMKPDARRELFSGFKNSDQVMADVEAVAKATSMMRDNSKLWANPSGTGANVAARAFFAGAPLGALLDPMLGAGLLSMPVAANVAARTLTGPAARRFALEGDARFQSLLPSNLATMQGMGLLSY